MAESGWTQNLIGALRLEPGERVAIVMDEPLAPEADEFAAAVREAGATSPSVLESHATPAFAGWVAKAKTQGNSQQSVSLTVYAYCVPS